MFRFVSLLAALVLCMIAAPSAAADPDRPSRDDGRLPSAGTRAPFVARAHAAPRPVVCDGDGVSGKRVQLIYVHADDEPGRYTEIAGTFQSQAAQADDAFVEAARRLGGGVRHIRYATDQNCLPTIEQVALPAFTLDRFGSISLELRNLGYNRTDRKYVVWAESAEAGCQAGVAGGGGDGDEQPGSGNSFNSGPHYAVLGTSCWGGWDFLGHELVHTLGAVGAGAPHSTGVHCWDQRDIMCYDDTGTQPENIRQICAGMKYQLDCNGDDYFSTDPAAGSYLATHWNIANSDFLIKSGPSYPVGAITGFDNKCVDVASSGTSNGTPIGMWGCNGTNAQRWTWRDGTLSALGKCMDVKGSGTANGTKIQLYDCNGTGAQQWEAGPNGTLRNPGSGRCLDAKYTGAPDNVPLQLWDCRTDVNQRWKLPA